MADKLTLLVVGLQFTTTEEDIRGYFTTFGNVVAIKRVESEKTGQGERDMHAIDIIDSFTHL